jgi:hypothetical protein
MKLTDAENRTFDKLIAKVATLDSTNDLTPAEKAEYDRLADKWNDAQPKPRENYGF